MYQRRRRPGIGLLFLFSQLYNIGFNRIPPVTLSVIAVNVAVYLQLLKNLPGLGKACVSAQHVWFNGDWKRLILAAFYHLDDFHLYYNMASFVWKGMSLERTMGSYKFLYVLSVFTVLTNAVLVGLDIALANLTGNPSYIYTCAAGFSGVIFALKVLTTYDLPSGVTRVMGLFPVPMRWACWAELILIQVIVPNASFTGHLAGILVGFMYVKGPLKYIMDAVSGIVSGSGVTRRTGQSYAYHAGTTGTRQGAPQQPPRPRVSDSDDEELQRAIRASLQETHMNRAPTYDDYDPQMESAIRESLETSGGAQSRWSNNMGASSRNPPYPSQEGAPYPRTHHPRPTPRMDGEFAGPPPYPSQEQGLYPRIHDPGSGGASSQSPPYPTQGERLYPRIPEPSAPPAELFSDRQPEHPLPYPTENRMPAATPREDGRRRGPTQGSVDDVRRRRLERFDR